MEGWREEGRSFCVCVHDETSCSGEYGHEIRRLLQPHLELKPARKPN